MGWGGGLHGQPARRRSSPCYAPAAASCLLRSVSRSNSQVVVMSLGGTERHCRTACSAWQESVELRTGFPDRNAELRTAVVELIGHSAGMRACLAVQPHNHELEREVYRSLRRGSTSVVVAEALCLAGTSLTAHESTRHE